MGKVKQNYVWDRLDRMGNVGDRRKKKWRKESQGWMIQDSLYEKILMYTRALYSKSGMLCQSDEANLFKLCLKLFQSEQEFLSWVPLWLQKKIINLCHGKTD